MKIMLIEDDAKKTRAIKTQLHKGHVLEKDIICAKNMTDFAANLSADIGLFIIDFNLPNSNDGVALPNGRAILETIVKAGKHNALMLAISSYPDDFPGLRDLYESHGCILADYSNGPGWRSTLDHVLIQLKSNLQFDFLIFCAMQVERNPYVVLENGVNNIRSGIDCLDLVIGNKSGSVILLPQMGLVNAAVTASLCIDRFKPSIVGMSGICGGFAGRAGLGQLFVSSMVYEYQSGKWASDGFQNEPYQVATDHVTLVKLRSLISKGNLLSELESGFNGCRPEVTVQPEIGIFTSGSAVVADSKLMDQIKHVHRKVNALDMELFAVQRAAEVSTFKPVCICAKTVVDLCDENKSDKLHKYGAYISAKFLMKAIACI